MNLPVSSSPGPSWSRPLLLDLLAVLTIPQFMSQVPFPTWTQTPSTFFLPSLLIAIVPGYSAFPLPEGCWCWNVTRTVRLEGMTSLRAEPGGRRGAAGSTRSLLKMAAYISNLFLESWGSQGQGLVPRYLCLQGSWPGSGEPGVGRKQKWAGNDSGASGGVTRRKDSLTLL